MADTSVTADPGSGGATFKADYDGTDNWPYSKIAFGASGTQTHVSSSSGLPVAQQGTWTVTLAAGTASIGKLAANSGVDIGDVTINNTSIAVTQSGTWNVGLSAGTNAIGKLAANDGVDIGDVTINNSTVAVTQSGTWNVGLSAGTNAIGKLAANSGVDIGDVDVTSIAAGSNLIGDVGISGARTSGGTTAYKNLDVDETEDQVKATAGQVYWIHAVNVATTARYLKFYNATAANVTVGTTTPVLTFAIPSAGATTGAGFNLAVPNGIAFDTAITVAATTGVADNDTGAPGANDVILNLGYA